MIYQIAINDGNGITRRTVIGDIAKFINRAYDDGALGVTLILVRT